MYFGVITWAFITVLSDVNFGKEYFLWMKITSNNDMFGTKPLISAKRGYLSVHIVHIFNRYPEHLKSLSNSSIKT